MSIKLSFLLSKNRASLKQYCSQIGLSSYEELVEHCKSRNINCDLMPDNCQDAFPKKEKVKESGKQSNEKKAPARRRSSKSKTKSARSSNTKNNS